MARLEARVGLVNDVDATAAADYLAVRVTVLQRLNGRYYFHELSKFGKGEKKAFPHHPVNGFLINEETFLKNDLAKTWASRQFPPFFKKTNLNHLANHVPNLFRNRQAPRQGPSYSPLRSY